MNRLTMHILKYAYRRNDVTMTMNIQNSRMDSHTICIFVYRLSTSERNGNRDEVAGTHRLLRTSESYWKVRPRTSAWYQLHVEASRRNLILPDLPWKVRPKNVPAVNFETVGSARQPCSDCHDGIKIAVVLMHSSRQGFHREQFFFDASKFLSNFLL
jgi:hypothetical protein